MKWKRLAKNTKALSPVIATIILVAVTVAVAIAVAAWMGALSFTYLKAPEEIQFTNTVISNTTATLTVRNSGTTSSTIKYLYVNDVDRTANSTLGGGLTLAVGGVGIVTATPTGGFISGAKYTIKIVTAQGNQFPIVLVVP